MKTFLSQKLFLRDAVLTVGILVAIPVHAQPGGVPLWTNRYNGGEALALAVDGSGNVFVTGRSTGAGGDYGFPTIKYSNAGVALWTNRGPSGWATAMAVDGKGNVIVTGWSGFEAYPKFSIYLTIKYSSAGVPLWTNRYSGPGNDAHVPSAVAVDGNGNVIVTGHSASANVLRYNFDYATIKYSSAGMPLWTNRYDGPPNSDDRATAVAVDSSGNVFVTGCSASTNDWPYNFEYATIKYSSTGVPFWTNRYGEPGPFPNAQATAIAMDSIGNVIVTGNSDGNYATIKYSSAGVPFWTNHYGGVATALAVDGSANVFVTGYSYSGNSADYNDDDYATIKYSSAGVPLWTNRYKGYNGGATYRDLAHAIAVDATGNIFVTGYSYITNVGSMWATIAYSSVGVSLWTNRYEGVYGTGVAVDRSGNVFVTGYSWYDSYVTIKYSSRGGPLLTIARTATNTVAVSWPSPAAAFTLQQNTDVASMNWTAVGITPADDGTNKTVIIDPSEGNRFFRLSHP